MSSHNFSNSCNSPYQSYFVQANKRQIQFRHRQSLSDIHIQKTQNLNMQKSKPSKKASGALNKNSSFVTLSKNCSFLLKSSSSVIQSVNSNWQLNLSSIGTEKRLRTKSDHDRDQMKMRKNLENKVIQAQKVLEDIKISFKMRLQQKQQILNHRNSRQTIKIVC